MKIVLNRCYGGFSISKEAAELMANNGCERAKKELEDSKQHRHDTDNQNLRHRI